MRASVFREQGWTRSPRALCVPLGNGADSRDQLGLCSHPSGSEPGRACGAAELRRRAGPGSLSGDTRHCARTASAAAFGSARLPLPDAVQGFREGSWQTQSISTSQPFPDGSENRT